VRTTKPGIRIVAGVPTGKIIDAKYTFRTERNVLSPMRDGVLLAMDLLRPDASGPFPVILMRTPYNKVAAMSSPQNRRNWRDVAISSPFRTVVADSIRTALSIRIARSLWTGSTPLSGWRRKTGATATSA